MPAVVDGIPRFSPARAAAASGRDASYRRDDLIAAEHWHFWFQARRRLVLWAIDRFFAGSRSLLDVGCGTGFVLEGIRARHPQMLLAGCDASDETLALVCRYVPEVFVFQALAADLPYAEEFDVVTALDVIEHIDDDREALTAIYRALRPGGGLVLTVPQHPWLWSAVDDFSCHRRRYTRPDLVNKVRDAGFDILRCTSCFTLTLPLMAASRLQRQGNTFDPLAELRIPRFVNRLLDGLLRLEWRAIKLRIPLPLGGSLLLVARRPTA